MTVYNWKHFTKRITIDADPQAIYNSWATQDGLENWFLKLAEFRTTKGNLRRRKAFVQENDQYRGLWHGYNNTVAEQGEIIFANEDQLEFSFSGGCIVKFTIKRENDETICELRQTMPMRDENDQRHFFIECGKGWTFYMTNLKSVLEGGIDLRNKNVSIKNVINS
ncbi:MAG TPA: SRPBCC domain-containing protein [Chitinophagaceae bacterium]|jgi:uncharacterized protein YndB with AHSA1/START domain